MLERARAALGLLRPRQVQVDGLRLVVPPGVLDPVLFRSGQWFARQVALLVKPGMRVLDLGCGTGVVGLLAQRAGAQVVAVDVEARAVAAALVNGLRDVRQGDLFAPVGDQRFDLIAFNPPYLEGPPRGRFARQRALSRALYGGEDTEVVRRFGADVSQQLAPGGSALVCWSDHAQTMPRKLLGPEWDRHSTAFVRGELLSMWTHTAPVFFGPSSRET